MYREQLSFTIHMNKRTLDLEASTEVELNQFVEYFLRVKDFIFEEERQNQGKTQIEEG